MGIRRLTEHFQRNPSPDRLRPVQSTQVFGHIDQGTREYQQDALLILPEENLNNKPGWTVAAVFDGMGGHQGGEVASTIAQDAFHRVLYHAEAIDQESIKEAFAFAQQQIKERVGNEPNLSSMGTTAALVATDGKFMHVAWVGDSRVYKLGERGLRRYTKDHTWVNQQVELGILTEAEAANHSDRHVLSRVLDKKPGEEELEIASYELGSGSHRFLVCSDGLTNALSDQEIEQILVKADSAEKASQQLVKAAKGKNIRGQDNITAVAIFTPLKSRQIQS
jgi:PPM family protein phosphatase